MILKIHIKKFFISIGSLAFLTASFLPRVSASNSFNINNENNGILNLEKNYKLEEKKSLENKDIINTKINLLRDNLKNWKNEIPKQDLFLINEIKQLLSKYGDPQGFCPLNKISIDRKSERELSEYLLEILKPIYKMPREQKLNVYGENNLWIPSLNISNSKYVEDEIDLLKELKPVYGYLFGDGEDIYRGPISPEAAFLINDLLDRVLLSEKSKYFQNIEIASLRAIKAANYHWPLGNINASIKEYEKAIFLLESQIENQNNISALIHLYGSVAYMFATKGDYAKMQDYVDKAFLNLSKQEVLDVQSLIETSLIPFWWEIESKEVNYNLLNETYLEYLKAIGGSKSSTYLWQEYAYLFYLENLLPLKKRIDISESIVKRMRKCSRGYDLAVTLEQKANLEFESGDYKNALKTAKESLSEYIYGNGWNNNATANLLGFIANIKIELGEYRDALRILNKEINILEEIGFTNIYFPSNNQYEKSARSKIYSICSAKKLDECNKKAGILYLKDFLEYLSSSFIYLSSEDKLNLFDSIKSDIVYRSYKNPDLLNQHLTFWLSTKGIIADIEKSTEVLLNSNEENKKNIYKLKEISNRLSDVNLEKTFRLKLIEDKKNLERGLYRKITEKKINITSLDDITKVLPNNSALIEFQRYINYDITSKENKDELEERYLAFLIKDNNVFKYDIGLARNIDKKIKSALKSTGQGLKDSEQKWGEVRNLIIKPMIKEFNNKDILFISPDGLLNNIPFSSLPRKVLMQTRYFGEEYDIRLISTARDLIKLYGSKQQKSEPSLVVANPTFQFNNNDKEINLLSEIKASKNQTRNISKQNKSWKSLPYSEIEGEEISKIINAKLIKGKNAKADSIKSISNPKILHIASHFSSLQEKSTLDNFMNPLLNSSIALAGASNLIKEGNNNGYLTALEISQMNLDSTELVVVSGCDTALGEIYLSEGNFGLKRALTLAGARSSLLSLWKVDDKITSEFMISFYKNLKSGLSRSKALINTQKDFRESKDPFKKHISSWGAFQLNGDWRKINF